MAHGSPNWIRTVGRSALLQSAGCQALLTGYLHWLGRFGAGVPCKQYRLIHKDGLRLSEYAARTFDGIARTSHVRRDNYFYYNCLTGRYDSKATMAHSIFLCSIALCLCIDLHLPLNTWANMCYYADCGSD